MKLSKAQLKALEAVEAVRGASTNEMYRAYFMMAYTTSRALLNRGLIELVSRAGLCCAVITPEGRKALEDARNAKP